MTCICVGTIVCHSRASGCCFAAVHGFLAWFVEDSHGPGAGSKFTRFEACCLICDDVDIDR